MQGKISKWIDSRGFGFVTPDGGGADVFIHHTAFVDGTRPAGDETIAFEVVEDSQRGKPKAIAARLVQP